jgi:hypothetical protein
MEKYCTTQAGHARRGVVIDFDKEIVEMVGPCQSVAAVVRA